MQVEENEDVWNNYCFKIIFDSKKIERIIKNLIKPKFLLINYVMHLLK